MASTDGAAVLKRARLLAERGGFVWELTYKPVIPGNPSMPQRYLSDERRQEYIEAARSQLT